MSSDEFAALTVVVHDARSIAKQFSDLADRIESSAFECLKPPE